MSLGFRPARRAILPLHEESLNEAANPCCLIIDASAMLCTVVHPGQLTSQCHTSVKLHHVDVVVGAHIGGGLHLTRIPGRNFRVGLVRVLLVDTPCFACCKRQTDMSTFKCCAILIPENLHKVATYCTAAKCTSTRTTKYRLNPAIWYWQWYDLKQDRIHLSRSMLCVWHMC